MTLTDKMLHAGGSALLTVAFAVPVHLAHGPLWLAGLLAAGVGAGRELAQWRAWLPGQAEWGDMAANLVGIGLALIALAAVA